MIEDSLPYLVNYFGCINGSRNVYMNFALFFAYGACWYVKNGIKSFEAVFCHHLLTYILLFSVIRCYILLKVQPSETWNIQPKIVQNTYVQYTDT